MMPGATLREIHIERAEMGGRDAELVRATARDKPGHAKMQAIYKEYGMAIPVLVQETGRPVPAAPTGTASDTRRTRRAGRRARRRAGAARARCTRRGRGGRRRPSRWFRR